MDLLLLCFFVNVAIGWYSSRPLVGFYYGMVAGGFGGRGLLLLQHGPRLLWLSWEFRQCLSYCVVGRRARAAILARLYFVGVGGVRARDCSCFDVFFAGARRIFIGALLARLQMKNVHWLLHATWLIH